MTDISSYPNGNVTIVFTDIEGSSRMTSELEQTRIGLYEAELRDKHRKLLMEHIKRKQPPHEGFGVQTQGDGHMFVFQFAEDALACMVAVQQSLHANTITYTDGGKTYVVKVRVGIHTMRVQREPTMTEDGLLEYPGSDTNEASRIANLGQGEQIIVSHTTYQQTRELRDYEQPPCKVHPWPGRFLKSFDGPRHVYEILYYDGQEPIEPGMRWFTLWYGHERNRFVDRPAMEEMVFNGFDKERSRLVTITGIGGTGKTRLAIACAIKRATLYDDGIHFVSLATNDLVANPDAVNTSRSLTFACEMIGAALNLKGEAAQSEALLTWLQDKNLLLVLDNYESVRCPEVGRFLLRLVTETVGVSLLVTGRQSVKATDVEALVDLNKGMEEDEARTLFLDRAHLQGRLTGTLTADEEKKLARILEVTDRIPLALELAAARILDYKLEQIADGLEDTLGEMATMDEDELRADDEIALKRHRSLERSLIWSYNLLKPGERETLAVASLFADTFDMETLAIVQDGEDTKRNARACRDASLFYLDSAANSAEGYRFRLHRATREFAARRLAKLDTAEETKRRFVAHYVALVEENSNKLNDLSRHPLLDNEWRNVVAAASIAEAMQEHWSVMVLSQIGRFFNLRGLWFEWERIGLKAVATARTSSDRENEGTTLNNLGIVYEAQSRYAEAIAAYEQDLAICREYQDRVGEGLTLYNMALLYQAQNNRTEALASARQSVQVLETTEAYTDLKDSQELVAKLSG